MLFLSFSFLGEVLPASRSILRPIPFHPIVHYIARYYIIGATRHRDPDRGCGRRRAGGRGPRRAERAPDAAAADGADRLGADGERPPARSARCPAAVTRRGRRGPVLMRRAISTRRPPIRSARCPQRLRVVILNSPLLTRHVILTRRPSTRSTRCAPRSARRCDTKQAAVAAAAVGAAGVTTPAPRSARAAPWLPSVVLPAAASASARADHRPPPPYPPL